MAWNQYISLSTNYNISSWKAPLLPPGVFGKPSPHLRVGLRISFLLKLIVRTSSCPGLFREISPFNFYLSSPTFLSLFPWKQLTNSASVASFPECVCLSACRFPVLRLRPDHEWQLGLCLWSSLTPTHIDFFHRYIHFQIFVFSTVYVGILLLSSIFTHNSYCTSVRPGRGIPPLLLSLRFLTFPPHWLWVFMGVFPYVVRGFKNRGCCMLYTL